MSTTSPAALSAPAAERAVFHRFFTEDPGIVLLLDEGDFAETFFARLFVCCRDHYNATGGNSLLEIDGLLRGQRWYPADGFVYIASLINDLAGLGVFPADAIVKVLRRARVARESAGVRLNAYDPEELPSRLLELSEKFNQLLPSPATAFDELAAAIADGGTCLHTGFDGFDALTGGGLRSGTLTLLAARPSLGKTTLAINLAASVLRGGGRVLFESLEMSEAEIWTRLLAHLEGATQEEVRTNAKEFLSRAPGEFTVASDRLLPRLIARAAQGDWDLVVVDYVQLVDAGTDRGEVERIQDVSRALKHLALSCDIPVLCLSQLSRNSVSDRVPREPQLHDLRGSGSLEQDADMVTFLYCPSEAVTVSGERVEATVRDLEGRDGREVQWLVKKHRNGPLGTFSLRFSPPTFTFREKGHGGFDDTLRHLGQLKLIRSEGKHNSDADSGNGS